MSLNQLQPSTIKLITSAQVITSVSTTVKELVENALDAGSSLIEIRLENNGLEKIEVKDNGCGISKENITSACLPHFTSKIKDFNDLNELESYGFRGEALSSLCQVSQIIITTKTNEEDFGTVYTLGKNGEIIDSRPIAFNTGTQISVNQLFKNLPVRKQFSKTGKKALEQLKKTEYFLKSFGAIHPNIKISFFHNKCLIWQKTATKTIKQSLMQVISLQIVSKLHELVFDIENISVYLLVPQKDVEDINFLCKSNIEHMMIFVKKRPIRYKKLEKVVVKCISEYFGNTYPVHKYPYCLININIPSDQIDVNLEPNKTMILIKNEECIIQEIEKQLMLYYSQENCNLQLINEPENSSKKINEEEEEEHPSKKIKLNNYKNINEDSFASNDNSSLLVEIDQVLQNKNNNENCKQPPPSNLSNNISLNIKGDLVTESTIDLEKPQSKLNGLIKTTSEQNLEQKKLEHDFSDLLDGLTQEDFEYSDPLTQHPNIHSHIDLSEPEEENENLNKNINVTNHYVCNDDKEHIETQNDNNTLIENESLPSPCSQMGKKNLSGFTKFTKEMRPLIIQQNPGISFTRVAAMLVEQWKNLDDETRLNYDKIAKEITKQKQQKTFKSSLKDNTLSKSKRIITDWLIEGGEKQKRPKRKIVKMNIEINDIKSKESKNITTPSDIPQLIGQMKSRLWIYKLNNEVGIVRHWGLEEIITFNKLMEEESVKTYPIESIALEKENFNADCYDILSQMDTSFDILQNSIMISSPIIRKNGFKIEILQESTFIIKEMATHIPTYGIEDLIEILNKALKYQNDNDNKFSNVRPKKIQQFFKNEAIRIARSDQIPKKEELIKLMKYWQMKNCDSFKTLKCLHNCLIFHPTINLKIHEEII